MTLGEKLQWLQQTQGQLIKFLRHPGQGVVLTRKQQTSLCKEIARLEVHIQRIRVMPPWAHQWGCDDVRVIEVASGMNKNIQGKPLKSVRKAPKIERKWTELR